MAKPMTPAEYRQWRSRWWRRRPQWWRTIRACWLSLRHERHRIKAWRQRHHPLTGECYSWREAFRATIENPPSFDAFWDYEMEEGAPELAEVENDG